MYNLDNFNIDIDIRKSKCGKKLQSQEEKYLLKIMNLNRPFQQILGSIWITTEKSRGASSWMNQYYVFSQVKKYNNINKVKLVVF